MATIISEFSPGADGRHYNGTCTQASAAMALTAADSTRDQSYQGCVNLMIAMRDSMFSRGACAENGAATISNMAKEMRNRGADIDTQINYGGDAMAFDWIAYLRTNAGTYPIVLQLAKCSALTPVNSWSANVSYHAICILNKQTNGYVVGDPNRPAGNTEPVIYSIQLLQAASPCGLIGIKPKVISPSRPLMDLPPTWIEKDGYWYGPASPIDQKQYAVGGGILYFLRKSNWRGGTPIENIHLDDDGVYRQTWLDFRVRWTEKDGGSWDWIGMESFRKDQQIADLQQQITALQSQQIDPKATKALNVINLIGELING
jgi:hypothetical protein